jgi:hypothetical protein
MERGWDFFSTRLHKQAGGGGGSMTPPVKNYKGEKMTFDFYIIENIMKRVTLHVHSPTHLHGTVVNSSNTINFTRYVKGKVKAVCGSYSTAAF